MNTEPVESVESIETVEIVEFDKKTWKTDPNAYARNYYHSQKNIIVKCSCGKEIRKATYQKHQSSKNHKLELLKTDLQKLKDTKILELESQIEKIRNSRKV